MNMRNFITCFLFSFMFLSGVAYAEPETISFSPAKDVSAKIEMLDHVVAVSVKQGAKVMHEKIEIDAEKNLNIKVEDYNFDGRLDFSISHVDDGMGTYTISRIYVFSIKNKKFEPLLPKCGDDFINVSISTKKRTLSNSYFSNNQLKTCVMRF